MIKHLEDVAFLAFFTSMSLFFIAITVDAFNQPEIEVVTVNHTIERHSCELFPDQIILKEY